MTSSISVGVIYSTPQEIPFKWYITQGSHAVSQFIVCDLEKFGISLGQERDKQDAYIGIYARGIYSNCMLRRFIKLSLLMKTKIALRCFPCVTLHRVSPEISVIPLR